MMRRNNQKNFNVFYFSPRDKYVEQMCFFTGRCENHISTRREKEKEKFFVVNLYKAGSKSTDVVDLLPRALRRSCLVVLPCRRARERRREEGNERARNKSLVVGLSRVFVCDTHVCVQYNRDNNDVIIALLAIPAFVC